MHPKPRLGRPFHPWRQARHLQRRPHTTPSRSARQARHTRKGCRLARGSPGRRRPRSQLRRTPVTTRRSRLPPHSAGTRQCRAGDLWPPDAAGKTGRAGACAHVTREDGHGVIALRNGRRTLLVIVVHLRPWHRRERDHISTALCSACHPRHEVARSPPHILLHRRGPPLLPLRNRQVWKGCQQCVRRWKRTREQQCTPRVPASHLSSHGAPPHRRRPRPGRLRSPRPHRRHRPAFSRLYKQLCLALSLPILVNSNMDS